MTCRVLKIARQPYYRWLLCPITDADLVEAYRANALFDAASPAMLYARRQSTCTGLVWGYFGGNVTKCDGLQTTIADSTVSLTASATNYITAKKDDGAVYCSTSTTAWNSADYWRLYVVTTSASAATNYTDEREIARMTGLGTGPFDPDRAAVAIGREAGANHHRLRNGHGDPHGARIVQGQQRFAGHRHVTEGHRHLGNDPGVRRRHHEQSRLGPGGARLGDLGIDLGLG